MISHPTSREVVRQAWRDAKRRCFNRKDRHWAHYGGRGITMCAEWVNDFEAFYRHIGPKPASDLEFDRIDNARGYVPGNVQWATRSMNNRNRRVAHLVTVDGVTRVLQEWCDITGINKGTLRARLRKGWRAEDAIIPP